MTSSTRPPVFPRPALRTDIDPARVLSAAKMLAHKLTGSDLTLHIEPGAHDPAIEVTDGERCTSIRLLALTEKFEAAGTDTDPDAVNRAFEEWFDTRPVSNQAAATKGIATLGWSHQHARIGWRVVVPRPTGLVADWVPTLRTNAAEIDSIRARAFDRARQLTVTPLPTGEVTVWAYLINPALSTAVLTQPEALADGHSLDDMYAVFTPGRPVAVAPEVAAHRLTEETTDPHQMLSLQELNTIGWM